MKDYESNHPAPFQVAVNHFCIVVQWLIKQLRCRTNDAPVHRGILLCGIQNAAVTICTTSLCLNVLSLKVFFCGIASKGLQLWSFLCHFSQFMTQLFSCFGVSAFVKFNVWFFTFLLWFKRKRWGFVWSIMQGNLHTFVVMCTCIGNCGVLFEQTWC